jgi:hypothetical protein
MGTRHDQRMTHAMVPEGDMSGSHVEEVVLGGALRAVIVRRDFRHAGAHFFTPADFAQQLGFMSHPAGHRIAAHTHRETHQHGRQTQEVLVIRKGRLQVDFYGDGMTALESRVLAAGDVILLVSGGHGYQVLDDCEMFEIKPGPYTGHGKIGLTPGDNGTDIAS